MARIVCQKFNDRYKEQLIMLYISGESKTKIAEKLKVSRQTVYDWLEREDVKTELDKARRYLERQGNELILKDLKSYIDNVKELANQKDDKRTALAANQYLIDRIYGKTVGKLDITAEAKQSTPNEDILEEFDEIEENV
ncbi:MAG: hypothetical protein PWQ70_2196 [Clostridiales bacterium]|nr:hypothetical protein [Clostridiales bacterium]